VRISAAKAPTEPARSAEVRAGEGFWLPGRAFGPGNGRSSRPVQK